MPTHPTHNVNPTDDLAAQFKRFHQRLSALERASTSGVAIPDLDARYVNVTGDTMTGPLSMNAAGPALVMNGNGNYVAFFDASREGYLQGTVSGMVLYSDVGVTSMGGAAGINLYGGRVDFGGQNITGFGGSFTIGGVVYTMSAAVIGNRIVVTSPAGYISGNYINMTADIGAGWPAYIAGQNGDNYLRWYNRSGTFGSSQIQGTQPSAGGWGNAAVLANTSSSWAAMAYHCGGVAPQHFTANGNGNVFFHRDSAGGVGCSLLSTGYGIESSRKIKRNINPFPMKAGGSAVQKATDLVAHLEPCTFQMIINTPWIPSGRRLAAYNRLNAYYRKRGLPDYVLPVHNCAEDDCTGSADKPCVVTYEADKTRYGFIAEDIYEIVPECVMLNADLQPMGIDYAMLTTIALAAVKELTERIATLEEAA